MKSAAAKTLKPPAAEAKKAKPNWSVVVDNTKAERALGVEDSGDFIPLDRLREATNLTPGPVPHRAELEAQFGQDLSGLRTFTGPKVDAALEAEGAEAAVLGDVIYLNHAMRPAVVAHEVAHMLQKHGFHPVDPAGAEAEARQAEARTDAGRPIQPLQTGLGAQDVAFRATGDLAPSERRQAENPATSFQEGAQNGPGPGQQSVQPETRTPSESTTDVAGDDSAGLEAPNLPADIDENPVPTFELPPEPEIEVDEEAANAAREAAEAALDGADDADGLMGALKDAPPSLKATRQGDLESETDRLAAEEQASFDEEVPNFDAEMSGEDDLEAPEPVATPESREAVLEDGTPAPAPEPEVDPTPEPAEADLNENFSEILSNLFGFGDANGLGRAFDRVNTSDSDVDISAGQRPDVPLEGETDPERVTNQNEAARNEAKLKRQEATQGVLDGPGPEQAQLKEMSEEFTAEAREAPEIEQTGDVAEGAEEFTQKELDPEVTALFDAHHHEAMANSLTDAQSEMDTAVTDRDAGRDAEIATAQGARDRLNDEAQQDQRDAVIARRQDIQDARQQAVNDQADHVADLEDDTETARADAQTEIDDEVRTTEEEVSTSFDDAESDAQDEVDEGDRRAEAKRAEEERKAEDDSWWDRATDWVEEQFDRLTGFINDIFDAVRQAVRAIIDAVKEAAIALIDAAALAIKDAIEAFGELARGLVNVLLAEHFPEVAAALNTAIDTGVALAQQAVDLVAEGLKAGITALLDALAAGLDAILASFQAAVNAAIAIARAALTGDWQALARLVLEPILLALGIQPEAFYQMIARAEESLGIIIDDPVGFLSNLVDSVTGGIRYFADNFLTHLQAGIIAWLTGALGSGITLPERWDLRGLLDLARQILGLTVDMIRRVAVRILGAEDVARIEFFMGYAVELITGGWSALWERIQADLGQLKDMVLDQIKTFLVERVVVASIMWLASLFNPVGALVKLVMTIWNFVMFLRDQLARIIQVVQTVVNTIWEIATGVLEPAMRGVERVLANLLPVAIDLLARLLGLGNVSGRVQRIIADVRQSIEDAIVRLIQRVLARFRGGRGGGAGEGADDNQDLMQPINVRGGGESHSLYIQENDDNAVPMMRSTPTPVETWLNGLRGSGLNRIAAQKDPPWSEDQIAEKRQEIRPDLDRAFGIETQLDDQSDAANRAEDSAPAGQEPEPPQALAIKGEELAEVMGTILEKLGLSSQTLEEIFGPNIQAMHVDIGSSLERHILPLLTPATDYLELTWPQMSDRVAARTDLPAAWTQQGLKPSLPRDAIGAGFVDRVKEIALAEINARRSSNNEQEDASNLPLSTEERMDEFFHRYLATELNNSSQKQAVIRRMMGPAPNAGPDIANLFEQDIKNAVGRMVGNPQPDFTVRTQFTAGNFQSLMLTAAENFNNPSASFGPYYDDDNDNMNGSSSVAAPEKPLIYFLNKGVPSNQSRRAGKNREVLSNRIRAANEGNHEWIPGNLARQVIEVTAQNLEQRGETENIEGVDKIIRFQHEVRTPTSKLIYKPNAPLSRISETVPFFSRSHYNRILHGEAPAPEDIPELYAGGPAFGSDVPVLQGHSGGIDAFQPSGNDITRRPLSSASNEWHRLLEARIQNPLQDFALTNAEADSWKTQIIGFFEETIWRGAVPIPPSAGGGRFDLYYLSNGSGRLVTYAGLQETARFSFGETVQELSDQIDGVLS